MAAAWVLKASWKDGNDILYRDLRAKGVPPTFALSLIGAPCRTYKRKDSPWILFLAQSVCPIKQQKKTMARPSTSRTSWAMPNCWHRRSEDQRRGSTRPLNTGLALTKPCKAYASLQCEQVKPRRKLLLMLTPRATALCPRESKFPRQHANPRRPVLSSRFTACATARPALVQTRQGDGERPGTCLLPRHVVRWRLLSTYRPPLEGRRHDRRVSHPGCAKKACAAHARTTKGPLGTLGRLRHLGDAEQDDRKSRFQCITTPGKS